MNETRFGRPPNAFLITVLKTGYDDLDLERGHAGWLPGFLCANA